MTFSPADKGTVRASVLAARQVRRAASRTNRQAAELLADEDEQRIATVLALPEVAGARTIAAYAALPDEPPTSGLLDALRSRGVTVLLPVLLADAELAWRSYNGVLAPGRAGTSDPVGPPASIDAADVVIAPALAVDRTGMRLGRGSGSYDRVLATLPTGPLVVALLHDDEVVDVLPADPHDQRVGAVVTECRVLRFR